MSGGLLRIELSGPSFGGISQASVVLTPNCFTCGSGVQLRIYPGLMMSSSQRRISAYRPPPAPRGGTLYSLLLVVLVMGSCDSSSEPPRTDSRFRSPAEVNRASNARPSVAPLSEPITVNLGDVYWCSTTNFHVPFHNSLPVSLTIDRITVDCSCTKINAPLDGLSLQPDGSVEIAGSFLSDGRVGPQTTRFAVLWAQGHQDYVVLANVLPTYVTVPAEIQFRFETDTVNQEDLQFRSSLSEINDVSSDSPWLSAYLDPSTRTITAVVDARVLDNGYALANLIVRTTDSYRPTIAIPVSVTKFGPLEMTPRYIIFQEHVPRDQRLFVRSSRTKEPMPVTSIDAHGLPITAHSVAPGVLILAYDPQHPENANTAEHTQTTVTDVQIRTPLSAGVLRVAILAER